jgi:hypothetical protein
MRDFGRPDRRLAYLSDSERRSLFSDLVYQINRHKAYSLTTMVQNLDFEECFPHETFQRHMGAHPLAFLWCMLLNHVNIKRHDRLGSLAYVVARSDVGAQITDCHKFWSSYEEYIDERHSGSLAFDEPKRVNALQAADMVAWANNRKHAEQALFDRGFEPLELLTRYVESDVKPSVHFHFPVDKESTLKLAGVVGSPVRQKGKRVSLLGAISPNARKALGDCPAANDPAGCE